MAQDPAIPSANNEGRTTPSPLARQLKQVGLCLAGAGFLFASAAVSRRSVVRLRKATIPPYYISNQNPASKGDSSDRGLLAARALGLATLNVMSFGIFLVGGISWAFDLSSISELRDRTRVSLTRPSNLSTEEEKKVEQEMEKLLDTIYSKLGIPKPPLGSEGDQQSEPQEAAAAKKGDDGGA